MVEILCTTCDSGFVLDQIAYYEEKDKKIAKEETADADYQRDLRYSGPYLDDLYSILPCCKYIVATPAQALLPLNISPSLSSSHFH